MECGNVILNVIVVSLFLSALVVRGCSFFGGKEMNQRKPPEKKASFFPGGATMGDSATALPG